MVTVEEALGNAKAALARGEVTEPAREASSLLALAIGRDKTFLIAHPEYQLDNDERDRFAGFIRRRSAHEPLQYISGIQEFYGLDFEVNANVLIPRPETEMVVEAAIEHLSNIDDPLFCDIGTGSGCIAVSILHEVPNAKATALDISRAALEVARDNARRHGVENRLCLLESDVYDALGDEKFELIAANPPYVPVVDFSGLQAEVRDFEPRVALTDEGNGLSVIETIIREATRYLTSGGLLLVEIGFNQSETTREMFDVRTWSQVDLMPDLQGIPRLVRAVAK